MKDVISIAAALSDSGRVRMLFALRDGERCACQLIELLQLAPSTVSRHLSILAEAGLVLSRKDGRWMHYRLPENAATPAVREALRWLFKHLESDTQVSQDMKKFAVITAITPEE